MEIAKLILQFLDVLVWPTVLLIVLWMFRTHFNAVLKRFSEGKEFELELGGQKLRIKTLEKGIEHVASSTKETESQEIRDELALLKQLSSMPHMELRLLAKFFGTDQISRSELKTKYSEAELSLLQSNLVELINGGEIIRLTPMGHKALEWMAGNN